MSNEINNEEILPVLSTEGETTVPEEKVEDIKEVVEEVLETAKVEEAPKPADVISAPEPSEFVSKPGLGSVGDGAMGSTTVQVPKEPKKAAPKKNQDADSDKVAIFSTKNVTWSGVGNVFRGYNIVPKDKADQWLSRSHVRLATPEEVAKEFGL